ncbi:MAG TPA: hypothetical protein VMR66_11035 [Gemmatimonadota bacterium]|nr:hypothetical protein [Gemmatimonadota bacterium]
MFRGRHRAHWFLPGLLAAALVPGCREVVYDILTNERIVRVPVTSRNQFTIDTGNIVLPSRLGTDKTIESATLNLTATNFNLENPVVVDISAASSLNPSVFGPIASGVSLDPGETRSITVVQTGPDDALVTASQSESVNIRFDSTSPEPGIGEIEFRFTIRVLAHKETPGTGAGTLIFY